MDAAWTALDGAKPCKLKVVQEEKKTFKRKVIDWMTL